MRGSREMSAIPQTALLFDVRDRGTNIRLTGTQLPCGIPLCSNSRRKRPGSCMLPPWFAPMDTVAERLSLWQGIWRQGCARSGARLTRHLSRTPPHTNIHHDIKVLDARWAAEEGAAVRPAIKPHVGIGAAEQSRTAQLSTSGPALAVLG